MGQWGDDWEDDNFEDWGEYSGGDAYSKVTFMSLEFHCLKHTTKKAWLVSFYSAKPMKTVTVWLPKSQCILSPETFIVKVPAWLADQNNLTKYVKKQPL